MKKNWYKHKIMIIILNRKIKKNLKIIFLSRITNLNKIAIMKKVLKNIRIV